MDRQPKRETARMRDTTTETDRQTGRHGQKKGRQLEKETGRQGQPEQETDSQISTDRQKTDSQTEIQGNRDTARGRYLDSDR